MSREQDWSLYRGEPVKRLANPRRTTNAVFYEFWQEKASRRGNSRVFGAEIPDERPF